MNIPEGLKYTREHEWIRMEGETATVGITDYAQSELGDIVYVEVETIGQTLQQEEAFGTVEAVKAVSDLFMPVGGEVLELNETLENEPEIVNKDPYGEGWMIRIRITNAADADKLLDAAAYRELIGA